MLYHNKVGSDHEVKSLSLMFKGKMELENWKPSVEMTGKSTSTGKMLKRIQFLHLLKKKKEEVVLGNLKDLPTMTKSTLDIY